jgi:hypothetical protein
MRSVLATIALVLLTLSGGCAAWLPPEGRIEPAVQQLVSEDDHVRIEELRVRGQTQRLTVRSKQVGVPTYDILQATTGQDPSKGRDAAGQRVWQLLSF